MFNKFILQGRLTKDPEVRTTPSGKQVSSFTVAWNEKRGDNESKLFMPCVAWGEKATTIKSYFVKGQEIIVDGQLNQREWNDRDGNKRTVVELIVDTFSFCGKKSDNTQSGVSVQFDEIGDEDGELPF